jgi:hypothetical protein
VMIDDDLDTGLDRAEGAELRVLRSDRHEIHPGLGVEALGGVSS